MKSRITIEVDFQNGNNPIIQILHNPDSPDVRDRLIKNFLETLRDSSWCQIKFVDCTHEANRIHIAPVPPAQLKSHAILMVEQFDRNEKWLKEHSYPSTNG